MVVQNLSKMTAIVQPSIFFLLGLCAFSGLLLPTQCRLSNERDDLFQKVLEEFGKHSANITEEMLMPQNVQTIGSPFICPPSTSQKVPESVHLLRPGDFKVIGALGDSLTCAYGAGASTFTPVMFEYPGEAASAGGDKTIEEVLTIPNILRKYNTHLYGYSTGVSIVYTNPTNKRLNVAISGSYAEDMPGQARELISKMKSDPSVDFENDWKFVTLFIGGNDLCSGCISSKSSPEAYIEYAKKAIQILHDDCPRTFLNVLSEPTANQIVQLRGPFTCNLVLSAMCPCTLGGSVPEHFVYLKSREFQRLLRTTIESGIYDDKADFAAVYQPFMEETTIPLLDNGNPDRSFFAPDCFHLSQKGQAAQAAANWNNLFQPVGSKATQYFPGEALDCPSTEFPYLYTNINSKHTNKLGHPAEETNEIPESENNLTKIAQDVNRNSLNTVLRMLP